MVDHIRLQAMDIKELLEFALDHPIEDFDMHAHLYEHYGLDSMGAVALFVQIERKTKVRVTEKEAPVLTTGAKVLAFIEESQRNAVLQENG